MMKNDNKTRTSQITTPSSQLIELTRLTIYNIVDNETDGMSSPCSCLQPTPGITKASMDRKNERPGMYTQEIMSLLQRNGELHMGDMCQAAHGLSLLLIAEYEQEDDDVDVLDDTNEEEDENSHDIDARTTRKKRKKKKKKVEEGLLFDGGPDPEVWKKNAEKLGFIPKEQKAIDDDDDDDDDSGKNSNNEKKNIKNNNNNKNQKKVSIESPLALVDTIVLSHYHPDHSNGLRSAIPEIYKARQQQGQQQGQGQQEQSQSTATKNKCNLIMDIYKTPIKTRGFKIRGKIYPITPSNPDIQEMEGYGARVESHKKGHVASVSKCFYVSGEIPRTTSFETGLPGHFTQLNDGNWIPDENITDERYVACKIRGRGIIVFSACSHAGIINVCNDALQQTHCTKLTGLIGGFHLAGSQVEGRIHDTIDALKELNPDIVLARHCTGWRAKVELAKSFEYNYQPLAVGGKYVFNGM